jgi:hypothetical protein
MQLPTRVWAASRRHRHLLRTLEGVRFVLVARRGSWFYSVDPAQPQLRAPQPNRFRASFGNLPAAVELDPVAGGEQLAPLREPALHARFHPRHRESELRFRLRLRPGRRGR